MSTEHSTALRDSPERRGFYMERKNSAELKDKRLFCLFVAEQNELRAIKHQVATEHLAGTGLSAGCSEMTEID